MIVVRTENVTPDRFAKATGWAVGDDGVLYIRKARTNGFQTVAAYSPGSWTAVLEQEDEG